MFQRMVNPRRVLMVLASAGKTLNPQHHTIFRNTCPQVRQISRPTEFFQARTNYTEANTKADEELAAQSKTINKILNEKEWCPEIEKKLNSVSPSLSYEVVLSALETLSENPETALNFFKWYKKTKTFKPCSAMYNATIRAVGTTSAGIADFWELAEEMKGHGFLMESKTFVILRKMLHREKMAKDFMKLFIWMIDNGENKPSAVECFRVLQCLSSMPELDLDDAVSVFVAFKESGGELDKMVYDGLHRFLTKVGQFEEAQNVMETMAKEGFIPDNITYSQLIYGLCAADKLEDACLIIPGMQKRGCTPDLKTWTVLIEGHLNAGQTARAMALFWKMVEGGCDPDCQVIASLVSYLCHHDQGMDAYEFVFKCIEEYEWRPSQATYKEMVSKLAESGNLQEARKMYDQMKIHGYPPFAQPFFDCFAKHGTVDGAYSFVMQTRKTWPSAQTYSSMIGAFCDAGRLDDANILVSKCPSEIARTSQMLQIAKPVKTSVMNLPAGDNPQRAVVKIGVSKRGMRNLKHKNGKHQSKDGGPRNEEHGSTD